MADQNRNEGNEQIEKTWREDESTSSEESRERSNREPASMADDRGMDSESLESEEGIESDLDSESDFEDDVEGSSDR
jgi:hypothetical protein